MTTDKASVAMLEALRDELRTASAEPAAGLSQRLDEVSAGLDADAMEHAGVSSPSVAPEPEYGPRPFEVRWDPTLDGGDGGWAVYLPTEHLLTYDGVEVATSGISGLTVVQDAGGNDTSWYSLDEVGVDAGHVWLTVTARKTDAGVTTSATAEVSPERHGGSVPAGATVVDFCIAELSRDMEDAAGRPVPVVRQSLVGALHLMSPGEDSYEDLGPFRIYPSDSSGSGSGSGAGIDIGEGYVQVGGFTIWVEGRGGFPTASHQFVAVDVVIDSAGHPQGELVEFDDFASLNLAQEDMDHVYVPIYKFAWDGSSGSGEDGAPTLVMDLRRMPMTGPLETFLDDGSGS